MRINILLNAIGLVLKYAGIFLLLPVIIAVIFKENSAILPFVTAFIISEVLGFTLTIKKAEEKELNSTNKKEALAIVFFAWLIFGLVCAIPYLFFNFSIINAVFEAISGITTTGSSVISDFANLPKALFFYRSMSQWLGGMGIIVLFIAVLPQFSVAGRQMFFGEAPVPIEEKITPRIRSSATWLWSMYLILTIAEILALVFLGKLDVFYSICTAFSTLSLGGFPYIDSTIAIFASNKITLIVMAFMFITGVNFLLQYKFFIQKKFSSVLQSEEFKAYLGIILIAGLIISSILIFQANYKPLNALLHGFFQTISMITTTAFASVNFELFPFDAKIILFALMFTGACAGSTSGGLKIIRVVFIYKYLKNEISKIIHPTAIYPIKLEGRSTPEDVKIQLVGFILFYFVIFGLSTTLTAFIEKNTLVALSGSIATLSNTGCGFGEIIGLTGNFASLNPITKLIFMFNMLVGRLELIPFLALLHPDLWHRRG